MPLFSNVYSFVSNFILSMILPTTEKGIASYLFLHFGNKIIEGLLNFFYWICKWFLAFMDFLQYFIQKLIGLDYWLDKSNKGNRSLSEATSEDIIFKFLYADSVQKVFRALIAVFVVLLIVFTIYQIIKSEWDYMTGDGSKGNSKNAIFRNMIKAIALVIVFPILLIMGIVSSNAILASIINAVGVDMSSTFGGKIFSISATSANKYRHYADANTFSPVSDDIVFYTDDDFNVITFGSGNAKGRVYYSDYDEYLTKIYKATKHTINSIMDPLVPSKEDSFSGFCFRVQDTTGASKYYFIKAEAENSQSVYIYLSQVLGAKVLSEGADWANEDAVGKALLKDKKLTFSSGKDNGCFISNVDLGVCSETTRTVCRNSWNYSLIYINPSVSLSNSVSSVGGQFLRRYDLASNNSSDSDYFNKGAILYNSDAISGYFNGGQFGVVSTMAEYQVMADVVDYMCDNNLTFYIMDATSSQINWNYSYKNANNVSTSYTVDNKWISNKLTAKISDQGSGDYFIKNKDAVRTRIKLDGAGDEYFLDNVLTFLTSYSKSTTLPAENEQDIIYTAKFDVGDESQGSRYIICLKDGNSFYPLVNGKEFRVDGVDYTFKSDHYASDYTGVVWAKGSFDTSTVDAQYGNPTYLKNTTTNSEEIDAEADLTGKYFYELSTDDQKSINIYSYNTRKIEQGTETPKYVAYNEGNLYVSGDDRSYRASIGDDDKGIRYLRLYVNSGAYGFRDEYILTRSGEKVVSGATTYYQYTSAEKGFAFVFYSTNGQTFYYSKNADGGKGLTIDLDKSISCNAIGGLVSANNVKVCYLDGANSRVCYDLVLDTISVSNPKYGAEMSNSLKTTFSFFDGDEYIGTFTKMSPKSLVAVNDSSKSTIFNSVKSFETNTGAKYYNIIKMGTYTDSATLSTSITKDGTSSVNSGLTYITTSAAGQVISFMEAVNTTDSVTCYRENIKNYEKSIFGSLLIEINIKLFKGIFDFKSGYVQEVSETAQPSITFINAGANEGITFDYFFDQNIDLQTFYSASHINYLILLVSSILIIKVLFSSLWGVIKRFYMITLYYLAMPIAASTMPIDEGARFGEVRKKIVGEVLSTYGVLIGLNVFFVLLSPIEAISSTIFTEEAIANSGSYFLKKLPISAKMLNNLVYILFLLVAFTLIGELPGFIQGSLVREGTDIASSGGKVKESVKSTMASAKAGITGESLKKSFQEVKTMVPGLAPASALVSEGAKKASAGIKNLASSFGAGMQEAGGGGNGEKKANSRDDFEADNNEARENGRDDGDELDDETSGGSSDDGGRGPRSNARDDEENPLDDEPLDGNFENERVSENKTDDKESAENESANGESSDNQENVTDDSGEKQETDAEGKEKPLTEDDVRRIIQEELEGGRGEKGDKGDKGDAGNTGEKVTIGDDLSDSKVLRQVLKDRAKAGKEAKLVDSDGNKYTVDKKGSIIDESGKRVKGEKLRELKKDLLSNVSTDEKKKAVGKLKKKKAIQNLAVKALIGGTALAVGVSTGGLGLGLLLGGGTALAGAIGVGATSKIYKTVNRYRRADDATRAQMIKKAGNRALTVAGAGALTLATGGAGGLALAAMVGTSGVIVARDFKRVRRGDQSRAYDAYGELSGESGSTVASSANNMVNGKKKSGKSGIFTKRNDAMVADVSRSAIKSGLAEKVLKKNGNSLMVKGKKLENVSFDKNGNIYSNGKKLSGKELRDARVSLNNQIRKTDKKGFDEAVGKAKKKQAKTALIRKTAKVAALAGFTALTGPVGLLGGVALAGAVAGGEKLVKFGVGAVRNFKDMDPEKKKALIKKWGGTALKVGAIGAGTVLSGGIGLAVGGAVGAVAGVGIAGATGFLTKKAVNTVKTYRRADDETKAKMIKRIGGKALTVAGAGALTLATGGAGVLALAAMGGTGGVILANDARKARRYNAPIYSAEGRIRGKIRKDKAREEINNTIDTKIDRELDYRKRTSNQSIKFTEKYINDIVDKRVAKLIRNAKETGVMLDGREKVVVSRAVINNEAIDDRRFVSNIPEAYRNVLVNSAGTKASRVIAGDVLENMAVENSTTVHKEVIDHISDDRKLEVYKSAMTQEQLETLKSRFAKESVDSTKMVEFIEKGNLEGGLGLSLHTTLDEKKGLMFSVNGKQVVDKNIIRELVKDILGSEAISTDKVINSMQNKGYTTNVESALASNYATSVNYSSETVGNVSSEYHQNVFDIALKDDHIRAEALLEYLKNNKEKMDTFLENYRYKIDGVVSGDTDENLVTTIQNKMNTDEFFTKISTADYSKELSTVVGRRIQDGSFKVEAFDLLSKEEQLGSSDRIVANIAEMSENREYAFTNEEKTKVGEFSAEVFDDISLVSTFASSQDEMKEEIINSVIAKYFGLTKEDGSIDISRKESVKLLKEMEKDSEFKEKLASGTAPKEELIVEFAKAKLQRQVSASNEVVGNINDKKPIEDMVIGKNAELVALLNSYKNIDRLSTEDVQRIAKARNEYNLLFNELRTAFGFVEGGKKDVNTRAEARAKDYISAGGDITKVAKSTDSEKDKVVLAGVNQALEKRGLGQEYLQKLNTGMNEYHTIGVEKFASIENLRMSGETKEGLLQKIEAKGYTVDASTGDIIKKGMGVVDNSTKTQAIVGKVIGNVNDKAINGTAVVPYEVKDERARELFTAYADLNDTRYSSEDVDKLAELYRSFDELQGNVRVAFGYQEDKTTIGNINNTTVIDEHSVENVDARVVDALDVYKTFGTLTDQDVTRIANVNSNYTELYEELKKVFGYSKFADKETNLTAENMAREYIAQGGNIDDIVKAHISQVDLTKLTEIKANWDETELAKLEKAHQEFDAIGSARMSELMEFKSKGITKAGITENLERRGVTVDEQTGNVQFDKNYKANQLIEGASYDYLLNGGKVEGLVPEQVKIDQDKLAEIMKNVDAGKLNAFSEIGADESKRKFVERRTELQKSGADVKVIIEELKTKGFGIDAKTGNIVKLDETQAQETAGQTSKTRGYVSDAQLLEAMIDNSSSREESTKNLAEVLRNVLSAEQISSLQKAGSENGFIALNIQQQNELLSKLATSDKGAIRVLERNNVDIQNSEAVINFLNSKLGANLRERLISNMDLSLFEAKELLAGKSEAEIHGAIQGEVEKSKYAEQVQRTQGELISTEKIQTQMVENAEDYTKLVETAVGRFKLIGDQDLGSNQIVGNIRNATIINDESTVGGDKDIISMLETLKRYGNLSTKDVERLSKSNEVYNQLYNQLLSAFGFVKGGDSNKNSVAETMARTYISTNGNIDDVIEKNKAQVNIQEFESIKSAWSGEKLASLTKNLEEYSTAGKTRVGELAKLQAEGITKEDLIKNLEAKNITIDAKTGDITKVAGGSSVSPEQKIKLTQDLLANGGLERFRSVAEFILNDTALKNTATGLLKSKTGEDLDSLNMIDKYNFLFSHYKEIAKEGTDERSALEKLTTQKIEFNNQFGNKAVLEKLKPEEIEVLIKDMGRDGKSMVAMAGQGYVKGISKETKIDIVPDTKMMSKEESVRFRENLATLQQAYTKGEGEEMFVSLFKNATLVNQDDIIREIISNGRTLTDAEIVKERAKVLGSNPEFMAKIDRLTAKDVIERKEFSSSLEKIKKYLSEKENTNFESLSEREKISNITRIFTDEKLRRKAGIVGTEFADYEKLAGKIKTQEIKSAGDYEVKQSFTNEQIMAYLRANEKTRQKLIEVGASSPNYMFARTQYESALTKFAINNPVMRQATMIQYANQTYSSSEIRQNIRQEITNANSSMYRKQTQKLTDKEIMDYINKHLEELKALFAENKLLKKNPDGSFELKNPKEQNFEFDRSMMNAMRNPAIKDLVDDAVSDAIKKKLGRKSETKKEYDALIKELADKIKDDERVQKVIDEKVKVSVPDAFKQFLDGQEASVIITDTIDRVSTDPRVADIVFSNYNSALRGKKRKAEAELRRRQADLLKAKK